MYVCMVKRTTVLLDDDVYEGVVRESIRRYGTAKAISRVVNELLRRALGAKRELLELIYSEKIRELSQEEFENSRRELSKRFEDR